MDQYIKIGQIINTHGHKGEVKVYPLTDDPGRFLDLEYVYIRFPAERYVKYRVVKARLMRNTVLVELGEVPDMNAAVLLKGLYLELPRDQLRPLPPGHYYIFQIIGLSVYEGDRLIGQVAEVVKNPANDIYVVTTPQGQQIYLPAIKDVVKEIDLASGTMRVHILPGLLD